MSWAINDWDKQENQWGTRGYVYMEPESKPLAAQLSFAEGNASNFQSLVGKKKGKEKAIYEYKAKVAWEHVANLKKKIEAAKPKPKPAAPVAKPAPAKPAAPLNKQAIKDEHFGTAKQQAADEKTDTQKEIFDLSLKGKDLASDTKDLVKTLKGPVQKGGGIIEARDSVGFGELRQIVQFALAKTPKEAYEVALERREIYLRCNVINEAAAKIVCTGTHFPMSGWRCTGLPELGPFTMRPIDPRNKQGTFALIGGSSGDGFFRKVVTNGRFIRAGITFCAETPDKKAHMDFSVGFNWEPGVSIVLDGSAGVGVVVGENREEAFRQAKHSEQTITSGGLTVFVAIQKQTVVIAVAKAVK